jgi:hypothetical protein
MALTNALLVRWANGFTEVTDAASIAEHGRKEGFLALGNVQSEETAERICEALFAKLAQPQVATTMAILPTGVGDQPWLDWFVADFLNAPDDEAGVSSQRVRALTTSADDEGNPIHVPELRDQVEDESERVHRWLKRLANGALGGATHQPAPAQAGIGIPQLVPVRWSELPPFSYPGPIATDESGLYYPVSSTRIIRLGASLRVAGTTETTVELWINGVVATGGTLTFGGGGLGVSARDYTTVEVDISTGSAVQVKCTGAGTGAEDLLVQLSTGS